MKIRFANTLISILFITAGCQTIQNTTDKVVEKENKKYGVPCERRFEVNASGTIIAFSSSGCF